MPCRPCTARPYFYPRPPRGGRLLDCSVIARNVPISIHALREEGDIVCRPACKTPSAFLSTPSARRATGLPGLPATRYGYFYPRPPRGGRPPYLTAICSGIMISIHALREEGDSVSSCLVISSGYFYPRPPRGGRRNGVKKVGSGIVFLSTPSARRATSPIVASYHVTDISIHALREEGDHCA